MTTSEYVHDMFGKSTINNQPINEAAVYEASSLVSGSFLYQLYELLWLNDIQMEKLTAHLESLYDNREYHGFLYPVVR